MRICAISHYCPPHIGGVETMCFEQARHLVKRGHQVTIVSSRTHGEAVKEEFDGVICLRVPALNVLERRLGVPYPVFSPRLARVLHSQLAISDACIIHSCGFFSSLAAAWICQRLRVPYIVIQNNPFILYERVALNMIQRINDLTVARYVLRNAFETLAVSNNTKAYVEKLVAREVGRVHNAVDHELFSPIELPRHSRRALGLPQDKLIVLTVGRLVFTRSIGTFLSVADLLKDDPRVFFVIVGDGHERSKLETFIELHGLTNCMLTGAVPHGLIAEYYRAADVFVLSSRAGEGLPLAVLEAWATGLPVVSTMIGGHVEYIENGRNGFLADPCAPDQIARIISFALDNPEALSQIGMRGRELALRHFTWESHVESLLPYLERANHFRTNVPPLDRARFRTS